LKSVQAQVRRLKSDGRV